MKVLPRVARSMVQLAPILHVVLDHHVADLGDLLLLALRIDGEAEAVRPDHRATVDDAVGSEHALVVNGHIGVDARAVADAHAVADGAVGQDLHPVADHHAVAHVGEGADVHILADRGLRADVNWVAR